MLRRVCTRHRLFFCSPKHAEHAALLRASRRAAPMAGTQHKLRRADKCVRGTADRTSFSFPSLLDSSGG
eukprot:4838622-Pyramimonas_sp.AAC.1